MPIRSFSDEHFLIRFITLKFLTGWTENNFNDFVTVLNSPVKTLKIGVAFLILEKNQVKCEKIANLLRSTILITFFGFSFFFIISKWKKSPVFKFNFRRDMMQQCKIHTGLDKITIQRNFIQSLHNLDWRTLYQSGN